jgi:large subunit ribosomal protein L1
MGKKKIALVDLSESDSPQLKATGVRSQKLTLKKKDKPVETAIPVKEIKPQPVKKSARKTSESTQEKTTKKRLKHPRSKRFLEARQLIDKSKTYPFPDAIRLLRQVSKLNFDASVELHLNLNVDKLQGELDLPHGSGKTQKVEVASDKTLAKLKDNLIDFDVLVAEPKMMPKLAKFAKLLGPKGLMPNPKTGTISDKPEELKKKLSQGATRFKSEPKNPLIHMVVGKLSFKDDQLEANLKAAVAAVKPKNITSAHLCSSMSPSIKLQLK